MAKPQRLGNAGTFFITSGCLNRRRLFQIDRNAQLLLDIITKNREHFALHAYVVMPDHIHLLITPKEITIERAVQRIKGGFSHAYGPKLSLGVWQRGFVDRRIRNGHEFEKAVSYIHDNPVAAHLADSPEQFAWSSACGAIPMDSYPSN